MPRADRSAAVVGWGMAVPERVVTNADVARASGVDEAWIVQRTGIHERRAARAGETTATLAAEAARRALRGAGYAPDDIDVIILATATPDTSIPPTAPLVHHLLGASRAAAFDVGAACSGFVTGLAVATSMIKAGAAERAVVIGAEVLTRFVDPHDRQTSALFGDGAGAMVLEASSVAGGLDAFVLGADGSGADLIEVPAGGSRLPATVETVAARRHLIRMNGPEVYRVAVRTMASSVARVLEEAGLTAADVDLLVLHQANQRIIDEVGERLGIARERVFSNVAAYGNTSAASIPIALVEAAEQGLITDGARVAIAAVGAGLTWGAGLVTWGAAQRAREGSQISNRVEVHA